MRKLSLAFVFCSAILLASCSKQGPEVPMETTGNSIEGDVYFGDKKVPLAMVIISQDGPGNNGTSGMSDEEGHYKVDNVPDGLVKIGVNTEAGKGMMFAKSMAGTDPNAKGGKKANPAKPVDLPKKYFDPSTSGLTHTLVRGKNSHDIKIPAN